jgi:hypothetical protein
MNVLISGAVYLASSDDTHLERVRPQFYDSLKKQMDITPIF